MISLQGLSPRDSFYYPSLFDAMLGDKAQLARFCTFNGNVQAALVAEMIWA